MSGATLTQLYMPYNPVTNIPAELLSPLTQMIKLHLHGNTVTTFPNVFLANLDTLNMAGNKLQAIPDFVTMGAPLRELHLSVS